MFAFIVRKLRWTFFDNLVTIAFKMSYLDNRNYSAIYCTSYLR